MDVGFDYDSWIFKLLRIFKKSIKFCGSNNFIKICNRCLDLVNCSKMISKRGCNLKYFDGFLIFFGFEKYDEIVPYQLP